MNDFLLTYQPPPAVTSRIECETDGCTAVISIPNDITEDQAVAVARGAGWEVKLGAQRWAHRCVRHAEVKR